MDINDIANSIFNNKKHKKMSDKNRTRTKNYKRISKKKDTHLKCLVDKGLQPYLCYVATYVHVAAFLEQMLILVNKKLIN